MYQPKKYAKTDPEYIFDFIKTHPFATLVLNGEHLLATHVPVLHLGSPEDFRLFTHIANHNEQFRYLKDKKEALLIFQGPHSYVSSSWYREKEISTWDYSAVHINVEIILQTQEELEHSLKELVHKFEKDRENPLFFEDLPEEMIAENIKRITGFWCKPLKIQAIAKLHQGFEKDDILSVVSHLEREDHPLSCPLSKDIRKENDIQ